MGVQTTGDGYDKLLAKLATDPMEAAREFETLRRKLVRVLGGRGATYPEDLADETLARVAHKLATGEAVQNLHAYSLAVARLVWLEQTRAPEQRHDSVDDHPEPLALNETAAKEIRAVCLDDCLTELPPESRYLIVEYYRFDARRLIERRRELSDEFGISSLALANRAQRLRHKLESCITQCEGKAAI